MKRFCLLLMALMLICASALAYNADAVVDDANLLSQGDEEYLEMLVKELYEEYDFQLVFHTTDGIDQPIHLYAADFYDYNGYGFGESHDGMIFMLDMGEREYVTVTTGRGIHYFSDYTIASIEEDIVSSLTEGDYDNAFLYYVSHVRSQLDYVRAQDEIIEEVPDSTYDYVRAYDYYGDEVTAMDKLIIAMIVALVITAIVLLVMISSMKTAKKKNEASDYVQDVALTRVADIYLYTKTTRRKVQTSSSGKGGSSTFRGSSGTSHGGGRAGKF